jgi:hypothetical protein
MALLDSAGNFGNGPKHTKQRVPVVLRAVSSSLECEIERDLLAREQWRPFKPQTTRAIVEVSALRPPTASFLSPLPHLQIFISRSMG